jgi:hypothetical protein
VSKNVWLSSPCSEPKAERALFDVAFNVSVVQTGEEVVNALYNLFPN